jgi:hypothetical protein
MKSYISLLGAGLVAFVTCGFQSPDGAPASKHERADAAFARLVTADDDRRAAHAAAEELGTLGDAAFSLVHRAADDHEKERVREACYELLTTVFAENEPAWETAANSGLSDASDRIRYMCAFRLGEHRVHAAHRRLRIVLDDPASEEYLRFAAAKSLAELGEADVLPMLYDMITSDWCMPRMMGNLGLQGLTGKMLNDFENYHYSEGAFVSGGVEARSGFDAVEHAERTANRYSAVAAYFRWLQAERPELYKHVKPTM